jgi:hypothetical protein
MSLLSTIEKIKTITPESWEIYCGYGQNSVFHIWPSVEGHIEGLNCGCNPIDLRIDNQVVFRHREVNFRH